MTSGDAAGRWRQARGWAVAGLATGGAQLAIQAIVVAGGILVIRLLDPAEYAYYTIANAAIATMATLIDSGLSLGVIARGGRVWTEPRPLGAIVSAGLALWRRLACVFGMLVSPALWLLLRHQGASVATASVLTIASIPIVLATTSGQILEAVPRLHQRLRTLQIAQVGANLGRLVTLAALLPLMPLAAAAIAAVALPQLWLNRRLRRLTKEHADLGAAPQARDTAALRSQVFTTLPSSVHYALSGQLTTWLISIFGVASGVASVGALGRLAALLTAVASAFAVFVTPRFARLPQIDTSLIRTRYWQAQLAVIATCGVPLSLVIAVPTLMLKILGHAYAGLEAEAMLMAAASLVAILCGTAFTLAAARGLPTPGWLSVPFGLLSQAVGMLWFPLGTVRGVILLGLSSSAALWLLHAACFTWRIGRAGRSEPPTAPET